MLDPQRRFNKQNSKDRAMQGYEKSKKAKKKRLEGEETEKESMEYG